MGIISSTIPNMVNGVSQQPPAIRMVSQAEKQVNGYSTVVEGLRKRPGTRHVVRLPGIVTENSFLHTINRDTKERYLVVLSSGSIQVFDLDGNQKVVNTPNGVGYLAGATKDDFRCVTVADYTFILNTNTVATEDTLLSPNDTPNEALVWVKQGAYGATYTVTVDGTSASYTVPDGSDKSHTAWVRTSHIAEQLATSLWNSISASHAITQHNSQIYIKRRDNAPFTVQSKDSLGENGTETFYKTVQRFSSLPARAVNNLKVEITGDQASSFDNYYVKFETGDSSASGPGVWKETVKGGEVVRINRSTMPHALTREADGTFTFKQVEWEDRKCGDLESNPMPSFVNRKINDIFFHRNRLGFVSDENVVFSRSGDFFNFFRGTSTAVLDDDPIDVGVSHSKVSILRHAVPFAETLLLFSDQTQFRLGKTDVLTPSTVSIDQTTEYECSLKAKPVGCGRYVYFTVNRGAYTGLKEYYIDATTEVLDATEVTSHVPRYVPGNVFKLVASTTEDCLVALSNDDRSKVFIYKFYWIDNEKAQASWSHWEFAPGVEILSADFIESSLYFIVKRSDGVHIEYLDLESGKTETGWNVAVHLDKTITEAQTTNIAYNVVTDKTSFRLPFTYSAEEQELLQVVVAPGGTRPAGVVANGITFSSYSGFTVVSLPGDWSAQPIYIGLKYTFEYEYSELAIREQAGNGGENVVSEGRLQLRRMSVLYSKTGYFKAEVLAIGKQPYTYTFTGRVLGSSNNVLGEVPIEAGKFKFPLMGHNTKLTIKLINDSYLPSHFLSSEWEGFYVLRSKRL